MNKKIIVVNGYNPDLPMPVKWVSKENPLRDGYTAIEVFTVHDKRMILLGNLELSTDNLNSMKVLQWKVLKPTEDGGWEESELDYALIPREKPDDGDIIRIRRDDSSEEDGRAF